MSQNSARHLEMLEETFTAEQHRNEQRIRVNRTVQNKDADELKTSELMLDKSLEFEAIRDTVKGLLKIINQDQSTFSRRLELTADDHILMDKAQNQIK